MKYCEIEMPSYIVEDSIIYFFFCLFIEVGLIIPAFWL